MNVFQLIKRVLDGEFGRIGGSSDAAKYAQVDRRHTELATAYADLTDPGRAAPDYSDAVTRFAYIYKYTTCHADIVYSTIDAYRELSDLFDGDGWLKVACVGGGPGSDFLGVLKYALRKGKTRSLKCFLLDRENAWGDTWSDVEEHSEDLEFRLSTHFQPLDVTDSRTWAAQEKYRSAQVFTFIYFLSEIFRIEEAARPFFKELVDNANVGAYFLFVDNDTQAFRRQIERFSTEYGLQVVTAASYSHGTDTSEEKRDLEPYLSSLKDKPKLGAKIYRALMVKR